MCTMNLRRYRAQTHAASVGTHAFDPEKTEPEVVYKVSLAIPGVHRAEPSVHETFVGVYAARLRKQR